jgi:hypothetical protein
MHEDRVELDGTPLRAALQLQPDNALCPESIA